ncbi:copper chaperone CopZ [Halalkalibacterium halodurans]|uniref:Copper chaperone CopZ n=5 Tax=Bacillaceae TaxID=186817 RepID=A0A094YVG0_ALKAL|nr:MULTISPECIES: copper chaperone CopZ [Bacillaceae]KGA97502.1 copper resistance protein CopZ [Alkalihalobacillus alcalophilus ATCC 27647 = CGMCC 1.3604]KHF37876.1 copper resistance protein CopZ [Halalkalibacter okhensis]MCM3763217.1 copper chaperone CopZ [Halalkalibacter oceani]MED1563253.1 copper chaperone CopZ [Alkalihalobacillus alcalophilus]TES47141.1 copper chaperone CopZ [Halalkalibacterium halodurans]
MEQKTLKVNGMSCGHCISTIENNIGKLNGVNSVKVMLSEGKVNLNYDSGVISLDQIIHEIEEQGYDVE